MSKLSTPHHIVVLAGGPSAEREVSLATGKAVKNALVKMEYKVTILDPDSSLFDTLSHLKPDLVFNALHGTYGEDGVIQGILDWLKIPYTGSKLKSSAVAMDKAMSRTLFKSAGLPVADGKVWCLGQSLPELSELSSAPWIVKPTNEGSSVGLDHCPNYEGLIKVLKSKTTEGPKDWLIEAFCSGVEVSIVVFDQEVWGGVEISPSSGLYDYEAKYLRNDTQYYCPPRISAGTLARLEDYALKAYQVLECNGVCRVDFITNEEQDIILELNTLPGMTSSSLVPKVAAHKGYSFESLMQKIIESAVKDN